MRGILPWQANINLTASSSALAGTSFPFLLYSNLIPSTRFESFEEDSKWIFPFGSLRYGTPHKPPEEKTTTCVSSPTSSVSRCRSSRTLPFLQSVGRPRPSSSSTVKFRVICIFPRVRLVRCAPKLYTIIIGGTLQNIAFFCDPIIPSRTNFILVVDRIALGYVERA